MGVSMSGHCWVVYGMGIYVGFLYCYCMVGVFFL